MVKKSKILGLIGLFLLASLSLLFIKSNRPIDLESETDKTPLFDQPSSVPSPQPTRTSLPKSFLIKTTFVPQAPEKNWDQPWQDACEEAALLTSVYYLKDQSPNLTQIKQDILGILDYETVHSWPKDVNLSQLAQIATDYFNLKADIYADPTIEDIKTHIANNNPVLVTANGKTLYRENKHFKDGGPYYHALTILGYNDRKKQFTVHDVGTKHGAYFIYSYDTLMESIHDLPPSGDKHDINQGRRAMVILKRVV